MAELSTEEKIISAAREVFVRKGLNGSRMQEIADKAGINKALLHYYFRSKDQLFASVFGEIMKQLIPQLFQIFKSELPLEVKVYQVCEKYTDFLKKYPELPLFVLYELQRDPGAIFEKLDLKSHINFDGMRKQLEEETRKGAIRKISLEQFMMNIISMMVFPFAARPMFERIMQIDAKRFDEITEDRKMEVPGFIMNALKT